KTPWGLEGDEESAVVSQIALQDPERRRSTPVDELRADYAARVARTLHLPEPPHVYLISAKHPSRFELPDLRNLLSKEKSAEAVRESQQSASARQDQALIAWIDALELPQRAQRLAE